MTEALRERFIKYRKTLVNTCSYGLMNLKILVSLLKYFKDNPNDYTRLSTIFFRTTEDALYENFLSYLFRIFDRHRNALSIYKFLNFIEANLIKLFPNDRNAVTIRIKQDKDSLDTEKDLLDKLRIIRDKAHFHQDIKHAGNYIQLYRQSQIPIEKLEKIVNLVLEIVDFYSNLFDGRRVKFELEKHIKNDINDLFMFINRGKKEFEDNAKDKKE